VKLRVRSIDDLIQPSTSITIATTVDLRKYSYRLCTRFYYHTSSKRKSLCRAAVDELDM
jgi:hypothetical protein